MAKANQAVHAVCVVTTAPIRGFVNNKVCNMLHALLFTNPLIGASRMITSIFGMSAQCNYLDSLGYQLWFPVLKSSKSPSLDWQAM